MRELTIVFPYFINRQMLAEQQRIWMAYPAELRAKLHVIVVDDCSPKESRISKKHAFAKGLASFRMFRLLKKIRWNWLACRNLGADQAQPGWIVLTDIDHGIPAQTIERLVCGPLDERDVYQFRRVVAPHLWPFDITTCAPWKPHNDTFLVTRDLFWHPRVDGYDERLSGCYGTSGEFRDRLKAAANACVMLTEPLIRYGRETIPDASTDPLLYNRKNDPLNDADLAERKRLRAEIPNWKPLHFRTPWVEVPTC